MARILEELLMDTNIFDDLSSAAYGFCYKFEKIGSQTISSNGVFRPKNGYSHYDFAITEENMKKVILKCQNLPSYPQTSILEITKLIYLTLRYFQQPQIQPLDKAYIIQGRDPIKQIGKRKTFSIGGKFKAEQRKISKVKGTKFKAKQMHQNQAGELFAAGFQTGGDDKKRRDLNINTLELITTFAILLFTKGHSKIAIQLQKGKNTALSYLLKIGGTRNRELLGTRKSIWYYLLSKRIALLAECIPCPPNVHVDWESHTSKDNLE